MARVHSSPIAKPPPCPRGRRRPGLPPALGELALGTAGDALDNALAETIIGLYKTECIREDSPLRAGPIWTLADLEEIASAWVHW